MPDPLNVSIVSSHSQFSFLLRPALPTKCLLFVTSLMCPLFAAAVMERKGDKNKSRLEQQNAMECVHMTPRRPCWRSKQRNGGHLGGVKYSFGN